MAQMSTGDRYGSVAIAIHWLTAAAILALLALGFSAANAADPGLKAALLRWHVPVGVTVFLLTLLRIGWWWLADRRPPLPSGMPGWQIALDRAVRVLLYAVILLLGSSGIAMIALSGAAGILFFGSPGPLPDFWQLPPMAAHFIFAWALAALACLHIAAAFYHHFYRRDGLLARMGIGRATRA